MRRRPWSLPLLICGITLAISVIGDWWLDGLSAATDSLPAKAVTAAIIFVCWSAINRVREVRRTRPS